MERHRTVSRRRLLLALFVAALAVRLAYLADSRDNPFHSSLGLDARYYDLRAKEILAEGLIGDEPYFMGPLYPHLLAAVYGLADRNLLLVRLLQACVGSLVPVLLYRIGRRAFDPSVALAAAILAVLYGPFVFYTAAILDTTVAIVLILWILDRLTVPASRVGSLHRFVTGILFGLAAAGRGNVVLFLPFALVGIARAARGRRWDLRAPGALLAGFLLVVGLVTARNYASGGDFVPLTSNGGLNLYIGNGPESSGAYEKPKGLDVDEDPSGRGLLERQAGRPLSPSEASAEWRRRATAWIRENPAAELRLLLRKTVFFFSTFEIPQIEAYRFQMRYSPLIRILQIPFGVVAPLALAATLLARGPNGFILVSFIYTYAASIILVFVLTRYRLPATPILLLYAVSMTAVLVRRVRARDLKGFLGRAVWAVPFALFCNLNFYHLSPAIGDAQSHYRLGIIAQGAGRVAEAADEYRRSIELDPTYARSRLNLGELLALSGKTEQAEAELREAIRLDPEYPKAFLNLGTLLYRSGRTDEGRGFLERAVRIDPAYGKAWLNLAAVSLASGSPAAQEQAATALRTLAPADPARPLAEEIHARAEEVATLTLWRRANALPAELPRATREAMVAELLGDRPDFLDLYEAGVSEADPSALYALGAALYRRGDLAGAETPFARVRAVAPDHPFVSFALGLIAYRGGRIDEARGLFLAEMSANPGFAPAWKNAAILAAQTGRVEEGRRFAAEYLRRGGEEDEAIRAILGTR